MNREQKIKSLDYLKQIFESFKLLVVLDIHKISAEEIRQLRRMLNLKNLNIKVFNNKLCKHAIKGTHMDILSNMLVGQIAIAWDTDNSPMLAKKLKEFHNDFIDLRVKCGMYNGKFIDKKYIKTLSNIPDLPTLRAKIINILSQQSIFIIQRIQHYSLAMLSILNLKKQLF